MDVFTAENEDGGYDRALPAEESDQYDDDDDDGGDLCRICRSPEGPNDPLRYPCACRGSIKYVHQKCLRLWLNRRGFKQCEVCRRSYSFVPVYSENAPERLPWHEFVRGLSLRALRVAAYVFVFLFNAFCFSLHPWGRSTAIENQRVFRVSEKFALLLAGFLYNGWIAYIMTMMAVLKLAAEDISRLVHREIHGENEQGRVGGGGVACVFWKSVGILCDWWHDCLTRRGFFHAVLVEPREAVIRLRNPQLNEFGAVRRFLFLLDDNSFAVLAISCYVSFFFVLLPFMMGRLVILLFQRMGVATQLLSGDDSLPQELVVIGYWTMLSLSLAYLGSFSTLSRAIAKKLSLGFLVVAVALLYLLWILSAKVWKNLYVVKLKEGFVLSLKFGVLPLVLGCWLDFCTLPILGITVSRRLEFVSDYPFVMIVHWVYGELYLLLVSNSMELIQKILQKRPFWFLLDVTDPNYKITKLYLGQLLFALAFHASLMVILVHLPIMTISFISPSFFPLHLWFYEERIMFLSMAAYLWLGRIRVIDWLVDLIQPAIEPIVHKWIIIVSSWLQLRDFFLGNHANQNVRPLLQQGLEIADEWSQVLSIAEGSLVSFYGSQHDTTSEDDTDDDRFIKLRIGLMLVLATVSLFLISTISMALPILVGRTFFHSISFILNKFGLKHDDLYGFWIGCYILRVTYIGACFIINHIMIRRTDLLLNLVLLWIRNALLFSVWVSFIPMLLGLLIDLMIIIPTQVPLSEPPVYSFLRDWLIGLVVLHIWTYLTMFTRVNCFATVACREKLKRIRSVGINRLPWKWLLGKVICPIIKTLLITLVFPFVVANSLLPLLQFSGAVDLAVQRLIWPVLLAIIIIGFIAKLTLDLFHYIHRLEYNDRYMVGDRVADFIEDHS
ncbi:hypothetical protein BRARA_A00527 [Brassica rapa]|uniref:RING-CH-type domain-containing protein n=1 Tax=Brassica campestris TaxID=3711 RepID=A0A398AJ86_BRACM|nr:hypothetical protein BRARA_A00527 [Brassica rapa]